MMIDEIKIRAVEEIETADNIDSLKQLRIKYLGRKGELTQILRGLKDLPIEERRKIGPLAQKLKKELENLIIQKNKQLITNYQLPITKRLDITKPGRRILTGHLHPLTKIEEEIRQIFLSMNFSVVKGPEVETEYYNFDALNIPKDHPARDTWNTFWLKLANDKRLTTDNSRKSSIVGRKLLRTHTSPMQVRYMETHQPPFQIIVPGRVFRYEATDASHETNFHQIEGLMVGKNVNLSNLKLVLEYFMKRFFGENIKLCWQPSYFPFVEPGLELFMACRVCQGKGCSTCNGKGWIEVIPGGMVHPNVFKAAGYDPYKWQGFAFGMGLDRLTMMKYKIPDIRLFYSGDLRFINQF